MQIKVRGIDYHFQTHQQNPDLPYLVLLHGFMGSGMSFKHLISSLNKFCNPITIDLLGHGKSMGSEMHYRFSVKEQSADLIKLISEQLPYPLFIHGYSMGGRLTLDIAIKRPDLFQGIILESTTFGIENEQEKQARQALDSRRADSIAGNFELFLKEWKELPIFKNGGSEKSLSDIQKNQNPLWMSNSLLGFGTGSMPCMKQFLSEIPLPTLLLAGKRDSKFVNIMSSMNRLITDSKFELIENANHRIHMDEPEQMLKSVEKFISKNTLP